METHFETHFETRLESGHTYKSIDYHIHPFIYKTILRRRFHLIKIRDVGDALQLLAFEPTGKHNTKCNRDTSKHLQEKKIQEHIEEENSRSTAKFRYLGDTETIFEIKSCPDE